MSAVDNVRAFFKAIRKQQVADIQSIISHAAPERKDVCSVHTHTLRPRVTLLPPVCHAMPSACMALYLLECALRS